MLENDCNGCNGEIILNFAPNQLPQLWIWIQFFQRKNSHQSNEVKPFVIIAHK